MFSVEEKFMFVQQIVKFNQRARLLATRGSLKRRPFNLMKRRPFNVMSRISHMAHKSSSAQSVKIHVSSVLSRSIPFLTRDVNLDNSPTRPASDFSRLSRLSRCQSDKVISTRNTLTPGVKNDDSRRSFYS
jgi:hypothetical protein